MDKILAVIFKKDTWNMDEVNEFKKNLGFGDIIEEDDKNECEYYILSLNQKKEELKIFKYEVDDGIEFIYQE
jgi:hypothetical protein